MLKRRFARDAISLAFFSEIISNPCGVVGGHVMPDCSLLGICRAVWWWSNHINMLFGTRHPLIPRCAMIFGDFWSCLVRCNAFAWWVFCFAVFGWDCYVNLQRSAFWHSVILTGCGFCSSSYPAKSLLTVVPLDSRHFVPKQAAAFASLVR